MSFKTKWMALAAGVFAALLAGCQSGSQTQQTETTTPPNETATAESAKKQTAREAPRVEKVTLPAGTAIEVRLTEGIDSGKATEGGSFEGTLSAALVAHGVAVAPLGSAVTGRVTSVQSSGRLKGTAQLSLALTSLTPKGGEKTAISTEALSLQGQSHKKRDIEMIGGGAAAGALIGALTGGKKGAAIGAGVGAGGGTGVAAATGKKEIVLPPETKLTFKLSSSVTLPVRK